MLEENYTILQNCVGSVVWTGHLLLLHNSIVGGEKIAVNSKNICILVEKCSEVLVLP